MNILRNFVALIKGMPDWHEKYNEDMGYLYDEVNGAKSDGIINTYTHSKSGTNHTLTGAGAIMRFTATAPWIAGDTITVNGTKLNPLNLEGQSLPAGAFVAGMQVVAIRDGSNLQFLTQSYADQFASINSQMANKANKGRYQWYDLPAIEGLTAYKNSGGSVWRCGYCKDDFEFVHICAKFRISPQVDFSDVTIIATLPEGYRPKTVFSAACVLRYSGDSEQILHSYLDFWPYGAVALYATHQSLIPSQLFIPPLSFLAEN